jgi:polyhydroxybutyrate depolymerase
MHRGIILLLAFFISGCAADQQLKENSMNSGKAASGDHRYSIRMNKVEREYLIHVPRGYDGKKPIPVVIMFHGGGGTARAAARETGWGRKADEEIFLAVFPEGSRPDPSRPPDFRTNGQTWADGSSRFNPDVDDIGYVSAVIHDLKNRFNLDEKRIYATGFSNGASMTYRVAHELSDVIASAAPVAGALWLEGGGPKRPVPVLYITGDSDPLNPLGGGYPRLLIGGRNLGGREKPPVKGQLEKWAAWLFCAEKARIVSDEGGVRKTVWGPCSEKSEVVFYLIRDLGHTWPGGLSLLPEEWVGPRTDKISANDVIWEFFKKHPKP